MAAAVTVRPMAPADHDLCADMGVEVFAGIPPTVKTMEQVTLNDAIPWREKKRSAFMADFTRLPGSCFVAETADEVVGFVTAGADTAALHATSPTSRLPAARRAWGSAARCWSWRWAGCGTTPRDSAPLPSAPSRRTGPGCTSTHPSASSRSIARSSGPCR